MKKTLFYLLAIAIVSCGEPATDEQENGAEDNAAVEAVEENPDTGNFGDEITEEGSMDVATFLAEMEGKSEFNGKISTKINECCQKKGCWMMVDLGNGEEMRVTFKDYGFFVPLNSGGKDVVMEGMAYYDTTSVADLQHYAEDAGKTPEEIAEITEPEISLAFEATGVIVK